MQKELGDISDEVMSYTVCECTKEYIQAQLAFWFEAPAQWIWNQMYLIPFNFICV